MWFTTATVCTLFAFVHAAPFVIPPHQGGVVPGKDFDPNAPVNKLIDTNFRVRPVTTTNQQMPPAGGVAPLPLTPNSAQEDTYLERRAEIDGVEDGEVPISVRAVEDAVEDRAPEAEAPAVNSRNVEYDVIEEQVQPQPVVARAVVEDAVEDGETPEAIVARSLAEDSAEDAEQPVVAARSVELVLDEPSQPIEARAVEIDHEGHEGPEPAEAPIQARGEVRRRQGISKRLNPQAINQAAGCNANPPAAPVNLAYHGEDNSKAYFPARVFNNYAHPSKFVSDNSPSVTKNLFVHGGFPDRHLPDHLPENTPVVKAIEKFQ